MLNPVWLRTFKALVEVGHFTDTANKLFMTQPGVTQHIKKLETACGHILLERDHKHFALTEQGRLVYRYATELENNEAQLIELLNFDNPYSGTCRIACSGALALRLYPELLSLQLRHPELVVELEVAPSQNILDQVESGEIDFGIVTTQPDEQVFHVDEIGNDELCLILPEHIDSQHNIYSVLLSLGLIRHPDANHYLSLYFSRCGITELFSANGGDIPSTGYVNQLVQVLIPVARGLGFTVLPKNAFESFPEKHALQVLQPNNPVMEPLFGVHYRYRKLSARCQYVVAAVKTVIGTF